MPVGPMRAAGSSAAMAAARGAEQQLDAAGWPGRAYPLLVRTHP
jgi:hypothetical protein